MNGNFFQLLWTAITQRFSRLLFRIRNLTNLSRLRSILIGRITLFFRKLLDVRPKDKNDYYTLFGYMISKRLAYLVVIVVGGVCAIFVYQANSSFFNGIFKTGEIRTYDYDSILLRMAQGNVRIRAKDGYIAYEGTVDKGYAKGEGQLFDAQSMLVYEGSFEKSKYEGQGTRYHSNGNMMYTGDFSNNLYNGVGRQFRESGSLIYDGEFVNGLKEGTGQLYDNGGNKIYNGRFSKDRILYSELLGKTAAKVSESYTGSMLLYSDDEMFAVYMDDINALYSGTENPDALENEVIVDTVYVLSSEFPVKEGTASVPTEITEYLGKPIFEGNSYLTEQEAIVSALVREKTGDLYYSDPSLDLEYVYDDYYTVNGFNTDKQVYLYTYEKDGMEYTFVCPSEGASFGFYYISEGDLIDESSEGETE